MHHFLNSSCARACWGQGAPGVVGVPSGWWRSPSRARRCRFPSESTL